MKKVTLGKILQENREQQHLSKKEVCRGLCTITALSRYEMDERVPDKFLLDALLERLGLNPFRYEFIASDQEFYYSIKRKQIEKSLYEGKSNETLKLLKEYENHIHKKNNLHWQYLFLKRGCLLEKEGNFGEATIKFKNALEYTKSNDLNIKDPKEILLTNIEIELFYLLGKNNYLCGNKKEACIYFRMLKLYIEQKHLSKERRQEYYPYILFCLAQHELSCLNLGKSYEYAQQAEKLLVESYQYKGLYEVIELKKTLLSKLEIQEDVNNHILLALKLILMNKYGKLTKEEMQLWENTVNQRL